MFRITKGALIPYSKITMFTFALFCISSFCDDHMYKVGSSKFCV